MWNVWWFCCDVGTGVMDCYWSLCWLWIFFLPASSLSLSGSKTLGFATALWDPLQNHTFRTSQWMMGKQPLLHSCARRHTDTSRCWHQGLVVKGMKCPMADWWDLLVIRSQWGVVVVMFRDRCYKTKNGVRLRTLLEYVVKAEFNSSLKANTALISVFSHLFFIYCAYFSENMIQEENVMFSTPTMLLLQW